MNGWAITTERRCEREEIAYCYATGQGCWPWGKMWQLLTPWAKTHNRSKLELALDSTWQPWEKGSTKISHQYRQSTVLCQAGIVSTPRPEVEPPAFAVKWIVRLVSEYFHMQYTWNKSFLIVRIPLKYFGSYSKLPYHGVPSHRNSNPIALHEIERL